LLRWVIAGLILLGVLLYFFGPAALRTDELIVIGLMIVALISLPAVELAELFDFFATALAAFAVFAGLFIAIIGSNDPKVAEIPWTALFLALFGLAVFTFGHVVRYQFVGY
jgi:hypothetical protein